MHLRQTSVSAVALPVAAYLALLLVVAVYTRPPLLGWIGLAVVFLVGVGLAAGAAVLFPRMRTNVTPPAVEAPEGSVLVLADARCATGPLCKSVSSHLHGRAGPVHVVAPILASRLHYLSDDEGRERQDAQRRLEETLAGLRRAGIDASGSLGTDEPLQSLGDALASHPARELVIVTARESHWLESDLVERARELVPVVERLVLPVELVAA